MFKGLPSILLLIALLGIFPTSSVIQSQSDFPVATFYIATQNEVTRDTSFWQVDTASPHARHILTLPYNNPVAPSDIFSEQELAWLQHSIDIGLFPPERPSWPSIDRYLSNMWLLPSGQLLLLTGNEVFSAYPSTTFSGYYEFLTLDVETGELASVISIDYHPRVDDYNGVLIGRVLIHPNQNIFIFTLGPHIRFYAETQEVMTIVDLNTITMTTLHNAYEPSWSPDGNYLAYIAHDPSGNRLMIRPSASDGVAIGVAELQLPIQPTFTAWADPQTVIYTTYPGGSESGSALVWHNISTHTEIREYPAPHVEHLCLVEADGESFLLGDFASNQEPRGVLLSTQPPLVEYNRLPVNCSIYSPQYRAFFSLDDTDHLIMFDTQMNQSSLDLAAFIPVEEEEIITFELRTP